MKDFEIESRNELETLREVHGEDTHDMAVIDDSASRADEVMEAVNADNVVEEAAKDDGDDSNEEDDSNSKPNLAHGIASSRAYRPASDQITCLESDQMIPEGLAAAEDKAYSAAQLTLASQLTTGQPRDNNNASSTEEGDSVTES